MNVFGKDLCEVNVEDLMMLIKEGISEDKELDFKRDLKVDTDNDKKELAKDVCAFANSSGGIILFGIDEDSDAKASELTGVDIESEDELVRRIQQILNARISPRIPGIRFRKIDLENGKSVFVVEIPKSFVSPHMVKEDRFYFRDSAMRHIMDEQELRIASVASENVKERVKQLRERRIMDILADDGPVKTIPGAKFVLHIVPLEAFERERKLDIKGILHGNFTDISPEGIGIYDNRYSLDGFVGYNSIPKNPASSFVVVFYNGIVEICKGFQNENKVFDVRKLENRILKWANRFLAFQTINGIQYPIVILASLVGAKGYREKISSYDLSDHEINRDVLLLPEVVLEENPMSEAELAKSLKPVLDSLWQAAGMASSCSFNSEGVWEAPTQ